MSKRKIVIGLGLFGTVHWILLIGFPACQSETVGNNTKTDFAKFALNETNLFRAKHGANPLVLNSTLNKECQTYAEKLVNSGLFEHSCTDCSIYGENLWMITGAIPNLTDGAKQAVDSWYNEISLYDWNKPGFAESTGHFTALIWKGITGMGIGIAVNITAESAVVVARYVPPGNILGVFKEHVLPLIGI